VPLIVVSRQLGHANPQVTATIYAHLISDSQLDEIASVFEPAGEARTVREAVREEVVESQNTSSVRLLTSLVVGLITRRSRVRIPPPLLERACKCGPFRFQRLRGSTPGSTPCGDPAPHRVFRRFAEEP
jgi:hypothetical protein